MHFGLEGSIGLILYVAFIGACLLSAFWRPIIGIYLLLPLLPLQTIRYKMNGYPLGGSIVGIVLVAVGIGLLRKGNTLLPKTPWTTFLLVYIPFTYLSLCLGALYLGSSFPIPGNARFGVWQDYATMPVLLLLVAAIKPDRKQIIIMLVLMCLATFALNRDFWGIASGRDYSTFSEDLRDPGNMGYAGVNGLGAYEAQVMALLVALGAFAKNLWVKLGCYALAGFSLVCLLYSFSRAAYIAIVAGLFFIALLKLRKLLLVFIVLAFTWSLVLPESVQQRILMSYDEQSGTVDHSSETRLVLWDDALKLFKSNPAVGTGFDTYEYMHREERNDGGSGYYKDTHNLYVKVLAETGIAGLFLLLWFLVKSLGAAIRLFRTAKDPLYASIGLGLAAWVVCAIVANAFGDRWTFLQVAGYMWVLAGLVSRALDLEALAAAPASEQASVLTNPVPAPELLH